MVLYWLLNSSNSKAVKRTGVTAAGAAELLKNLYVRQQNEMTEPWRFLQLPAAPGLQVWLQHKGAQWEQATKACIKEEEKQSNSLCRLKKINLKKGKR